MSGNTCTNSFSLQSINKQLKIDQRFKYQRQNFKHLMQNIGRCILEMKVGNISCVENTLIIKYVRFSTLSLKTSVHLESILPK